MIEALDTVALWWGRAAMAAAAAVLLAMVGGGLRAGVRRLMRRGNACAR